MKPIVVKDTIKVGPFDFQIKTNQETRDQLRLLQNWGLTGFNPPEIAIDTLGTPERVSNTFLHEMLHAIDHIWTGNTLSEEQVRAMAYGLTQVFEQLGVRFTVK